MATDLGFNTDIKIGLTYETMAEVKIEPIVEFIPGSEQERNPCGGDSYQTSPRCRWTYPDRELTGEQFYQLKSLVGNSPSANVYFTTPTQTINPATYQPIVVAYSGVLHWPDEGVMMGRYYRWVMPDDGLLFTNLQSAP